MYERNGNQLSPYIYFLQFVFTPDLHLTREPPTLLHTGWCSWEDSAAEQSPPHSVCGCTAAFPCREEQGCLPSSASGCHKGFTSAGHPAGILHWTVCRISSWFLGYLTSHCLFAFADFVFLPNSPLAPLHTTASGTSPVRTGQNAGNNHTREREPFHRIVTKTGKDWARLPASAPCSTQCTHKHTQSWRKKQQHCRCCSISHQRHTLHVCFDLCMATGGMCMFSGWFPVAPVSGFCSPWCSAVELMWQEHGNGDMFITGDGWTLLFFLPAQLSGCLHHCHLWPLLHEEGAY